MIPLRPHIRQQSNNTPIRQRAHPQLASQFTIIRTPRRKDIISPMRIQNNKGAIIKHHGIENQQRNYNSNTNTNKSAAGKCINHHDKLGKYNIQIDGETFTYCEKCSVHLISQGFHVKKIENLTTRQIQKLQLGSSQIQEFKRVERHLNPQLGTHPRMRQLKSFVRQSQKLKSHFNDNLLIFQEIPNHFNEQIQIIQQFYDTMVTYVNSLRSEHRSILQEQNKRYCQLAEVMTVEIQQNNLELENILEDILSNIKEIVVGISEQKYRESINYYLQKIQFFKGRIDDQKMSFQEITRLQQSELKTILQQFKKSVNTILGIKDVTKQNVNVQYFKQPLAENPSLFKNINTQYRTQPHAQVRDPFRTLFSQQQHQPEQSPHFKVI